MKTKILKQKVNRNLSKNPYQKIEIAKDKTTLTKDQILWKIAKLSMNAH